MADSNFWEPTIQLYSGLFQKPKMSDKLLQKPPFKYLFDIVTATIESTGFGEGLYTEQEKDSNYYENRELKIMYLRKIIDLTQYAIGKGLQAKPNKIVAGLEPENTNFFLQELHRSATTPDLAKKGPKIIKKLLAKYEEEAKGGGEAGGEAKEEEKPQPPTQEKPKEAPKKEAPKKEPKKEDPPQQNKVERKEDRSNSRNPGGQVDEPVPVNKNLRPSSAVKAPPKISNNVVKVTDNSSKGKGTSGVIVDRGNNGDEEEQDKDTQQNDARGGKVDLSAAGKEASKFTRQALNDGLGIVPSAQKDQAGEDEGKGITFQTRVGKGKKTATGGTSAASGSSTAGLQGGSSANDIQSLTTMIQEIAKNANPLGKSLEFITDDIESMNHEIDYWTKQYKQYKEKMQNELKVSDEMLQPIQDQIAEIEEKISDKKNKISNVKAQLIKNQSQIQTLLYSVVSTK